MGPWVGGLLVGKTQYCLLFPTEQGQLTKEDLQSKLTPKIDYGDYNL